jgi:large subunit GTPase 1
VGVASQPGKTKHLQTLILSETLTLCDCPGLVFPSLLSSRAEMVTCGVLPIDQVKDVLSPVEIVCLRVKSKDLESRYGVSLGGRVNPRVLLQKIANHRGFFTGNGLPDEVKAGKMVLKDYVNGKIPFSHQPPGSEEDVEEEAVEEVKENIDQEFFQEKTPGRLTVDQSGTVKYEGSVKLNKQEKRELKFAARRGEDPNEKLKQILKAKGMKTS